MGKVTNETSSYPTQQGKSTNTKNFLSKSSSSSSIFPVTLITKVRVINHDRPGWVKMIELPQNEASNRKIWPAALTWIIFPKDAVGEKNFQKRTHVSRGCVFPYNFTPVSQSFPEVMTAFKAKLPSSYTDCRGRAYLNTDVCFAPKKRWKGKFMDSIHFWNQSVRLAATPKENSFMLWTQIHGCIRTSKLTPMNLWACFTTFEVESTLEVMKWNTTCLRWQLQVDPLGSWVACYEKSHQFLSVGFNFVLNQTGLEKTHPSNIPYFLTNKLFLVRTMML